MIKIVKAVRALARFERAGLPIAYMLERAGANNECIHNLVCITTLTCKCRDTYHNDRVFMPIEMFYIHHRKLASFDVTGHSRITNASTARLGHGN